MNPTTIEKLISLYSLQPHPEGGYFKETFRDTGVIHQESLPNGVMGARNYSTAIYFLLPQGQKSCLHRIQSDEVWHFYLGGSLCIIQISPEGKIDRINLGQDIFNGEKLQHVVPRGYWFGSIPNPQSAYSFVGCTVAPGFDFKDFEMADREVLLNQYPHAKDEIILLTN